MNPWAINPVWQNYSSLFREAISASEAKTEMERSHHMTASLYFGIAALEAFLNQEMRRYLSASKSEDEIFETLRRGKIMSKLKKWPTELLGAPLPLDLKTYDLLTVFNDIRGDLTHPKTHGFDIYAKLDDVEPSSVIDSVAEYIVKFHELQKTRFPYWLFGWNYLNPRPDAHEIFIINDQQFANSMKSLGFKVSQAFSSDMDPWLNHHLGSFQGYLSLRKALIGLDRCEPKWDRFPFKPILCRNWWKAEHQHSCGNVSKEAIDRALRYDA
ncbi:hypothetical protein [Geothrix sp. PMB-07]|uniref:hypothetical protein n=1 Tax=Geothrix sp. PMB-07 TaxID=3068640 RepID=UPI002740B407|nr:hypothetical protein [Geothrix sp. PMB-07]WLT32731.1 hypothetical protein Q9293_05210 [Geothrix sp. PMB-07]